MNGVFYIALAVPYFAIDSSTFAFGIRPRQDRLVGLPTPSFRECPFLSPMNVMYSIKDRFVPGVALVETVLPLLSTSLSPSDQRMGL